MHLRVGQPLRQSSRPIVSESDACRSSPPCQPSSTLRRGGLGTNGNILHVASGGYHSDASPDDPCGLKGSRPDLVCDACRHGPHGESLPSPCLECTCSNSSVLHTASGGSTMCLKAVDPCGRTAETEDSCSPQPLEAQQPESRLAAFIRPGDLGSSAGCGISAGCGLQQHPPFTP